MGMHGDYKINECGEIIRNEPYQSQKPNQEPEKKRKGGWIVWLIVMSIAAYFGYEMYHNNSISNNSVDDHGYVNVNGEYYNSNNSNNNYAFAPQHFLYFLPEPHGHGSLRPIFLSFTTVPDFFCSR